MTAGHVEPISVSRTLLLLHVTEPSRRALGAAMVLCRGPRFHVSVSSYHPASGLVSYISAFSDGHQQGASTTVGIAAVASLRTILNNTFQWAAVLLHDECSCYGSTHLHDAANSVHRREEHKGAVEGSPWRLAPRLSSRIATCCIYYQESNAS